MRSNINEENVTPTTGGILASQSPHCRSVLQTLLPFAVRCLGPTAMRHLCISLSALRSCLGHIRTALREGQYSIGIGPVFAQSGQLDLRTHSRNEGIEKVRSRFPWMDVLDIQIFLAGFDAGERFAGGNAGTQPHTE
jgi:hypothetical protein